MVLAAFCGLASAQVVSVTCTDTTSDAATLNTAISGSAVGAQIQIHGTCLVNNTIVLYPDRSYLGDSRTGTVIQQANGTNLPALLASQGWTTNSSYADNPITIAHMTLNGNSQSNSGTNVLVIRSWLTTIDDVKVEYAPVDGIQFTSLSQSGTALSNSIENSRVSNVFITNSGANGFEVIDPNNGVTDSDLIDSWIANSGQSAITLANAAGWKIEGNHIYGVQQNGIYAQRCFGTAIKSNYIEDFGDAGGATYYGIACNLQGGVGSVIANNKVFMFATEKSSGTFIYIGVPWVNYGEGILNVHDNVIVGANTSNDIGLSYQATGTKTLLVLSSNNVNGVKTGRVLGAGVSLVTAEGGAATALTPTVTVTPSQNTLNSNQSLTVTATVTGSGATPTGTLTLSGGGYTSAAVTLSGGTFTFTIPANSLNAGTDTLTVNYSGDTNYAAGVGTASVTVTESMFTLSASAPTAISSPGGSATSTVTVSSSTGYAGTVTLACALTSNATGDTYLPTCSVPSTAVSMGGTAIVTVNTTAATSELVYPRVGGKGRGLFGAGGGAVLAFLAFLGIPIRRRSWRSMLGVLVLLAGLGCLTSCGGGSSNPVGTPGTSTGSYTFTVTGTGNLAVSPAPTTTFTLTVN
jgi:hypothetical protein